MTNRPMLKDNIQYLINNIYDDINNLKSSVLDSDTIDRLVALADNALTKDDVTNVQNKVHVESFAYKVSTKYIQKDAQIGFTFIKPMKSNYSVFIKQLLLNHTPSAIYQTEYNLTSYTPTRCGLIINNFGSAFPPDNDAILSIVCVENYK